MVVLNHAEMYPFLRAAEQHFGDASEAVFLLGVQFNETMEKSVCGYATAQYIALGRRLQLQLGGSEPFDLGISSTGPVITEGELEAFHIRKLSAGTWALNPSLNVPEVLHAYVVIYDVPDPAPWEERLVIL